MLFIFLRRNEAGWLSYKISHRPRPQLVPIERYDFLSTSKVGLLVFSPKGGRFPDTQNYIGSRENRCGTCVSLLRNFLKSLFRAVFKPETSCTTVFRYAEQESAIILTLKIFVLTKNLGFFTKIWTFFSIFYEKINFSNCRIGFQVKITFAIDSSHRFYPKKIGLWFIKWVFTWIFDAELGQL